MTVKNEQIIQAKTNAEQFEFQLRETTRWTDKKKNPQDFMEMFQRCDSLHVKHTQNKTKKGTILHLATPYIMPLHEILKTFKTDQDLF